MPEQTSQESRMPGAEANGQTVAKRTWKEEAVMATEWDGPLGQAQKRLVQTTFAKVEPIAEVAYGQPARPGHKRD